MHKKSIRAQKVEFDKLLKIIEKNLINNQITLAITNLNKALLIEPQNYAILNEIGNCHFIIGDNITALEYHNKAALINDKDPTILCNIGLDLYKLDRLNEAIQFFNFALELDDSHYLSYSGLTSALHNSGDMNNLYLVSTKAITFFPEKYDFHLSLGLALVYLEKFEEALYCLETASILNPTSIETKLNTAAAYSLMGQSDLAIKIYEDLIASLTSINHPKIALIKFNLSFEYLKKGQLKKGWENYEYGFNEAIPFNQRRKPNRIFKAKKWTGQILRNQTLLVWREQGLGDELLFLSLIPDLLKLTPNLIIESDARLINILKLTFPKAHVRESKNIAHEDFEYEISLGSLCKYLRNDINKFKNSGKLFSFQSIDHLGFISLKKNNPNKIFIGICWRSGVLNLQRNNNYIPLAEWESIFKIPNAIFINLQYGDCEQEVIDAEEKFNVSIARWQDIDLKNDLDTVFGMIQSLDFVVSAATAVSSMSYLSGITTFVFQPNRNWTNLGTDYYPWSKYMHQVIPNKSESITSTLEEISQKIINSHLLN